MPPGIPSIPVVTAPTPQLTPRRIVLVSMLVVGGVVGYDIVRTHGTAAQTTAQDGFKIAWSMGLLFLLLAIGADTVPTLAGPFAALIALSVLIGRSSAVDQIVNVVPSPSTKGRSK